MTDAPPKPATFNGDISTLPPALAHLREQRVWVCWVWALDEKREKWTKPPRRADDPERNASTSSPNTWGSHELAVKQVLNGKADGIGFAVKGRDIGGIDFDHCFDRATGLIAPWAYQYVKQFPSAYLEATVSGTGLRILGLSKLKDFAPKFKLPENGEGAAIEFFSNSTHYLTLSCRQIGNCSVLPPIEAGMTSIANGLGNSRRQQSNGFDFTAEQPQSDSEEKNKQAAREQRAKPQESAEEWSFARDNLIRSALAVIPADEAKLNEIFKAVGGARPAWLNIGFALHSLQWGERGFAIWEGWCRGCANEYDPNALRKDWNRMREDRDKLIKIGTLFHYAKLCGGAPPERPGEGTTKDNSETLLSTRASDVKISAIQWLWPDRFAIGMLGLIVGLPDEGKGQILADMAARVTNADVWPCGEGRAPQGNVILLTAEDDPSATVVPRLIAAGADLTRIHIVSMVRHKGGKRMFNLVTDLPLLRQKIGQVGNIKMVQIDPISAYMGVGKMDSYRSTDVRGVLAPLVELAQEKGAAIIGIMHFNKKVDVTNALLRISDSLAYAALARHCFAVINDAEHDRKLFVKAKNNVARADIKALAFRFSLREVGHDQDTNEPIWAPHVLWDPQHVDISATEAMEAAATAGANILARDEAKEFLQTKLAAGAVKIEEVKEEAEANGIAERTLKRAKQSLRVKAWKEKKMDGEWFWELPGPLNDPRCGPPDH